MIISCSVFWIDGTKHKFIVCLWLVIIDWITWLLICCLGVRHLKEKHRNNLNLPWHHKTLRIFKGYSKIELPITHHLGQLYMLYQIQEYSKQLTWFIIKYVYLSSSPNAFQTSVTKNCSGWTKYSSSPIVLGSSLTSVCIWLIGSDSFSSFRSERSRKFFGCRCEDLLLCWASPLLRRKGCST